MAGRTDLEQLVYQMSVDQRAMQRQLDRALASVNGTADRAQRRFDRLGRDMAQSLAPVQLAAQAAFAAIVYAGYQAARRAEAVEGAFAQTFRDVRTEAEAVVTDITTRFARVPTDIRDNLTQLTSIMAALGVETEQALAIVAQLQERSLDIAAFRDVSDAEAFRAVISGITGETEPLRRFGVVVNETAVALELQRLGFEGNATEASEAAKAIARSNIILRQSAEMHGQVAREADSVTEAENRARTAFVQAAEDLGRQFLPVAAQVLRWAADATAAFNDLDPAVQTAGLAMLGLIAASGPIAGLVTGLARIVTWAGRARAALAGLVGGSAAAGAAGAGAAAGVAAAVGLPLLTSGDTPQNQSRDQIRADMIRRRDRYTRQGEAAAAQAMQREIDALDRRVRQVAELRDSVIAAVGGTGNNADDPTAGFGDFGLGDLNRRGPGAGSGGGSGSRASGPSARDLAERRELFDLERAIERARAADNDREVDRLQEQIDLIRLTQDYRAEGYQDAEFLASAHLAALNQATDAAEARAEAEARLQERLQARAEAEEETARWAERTLAVDIQIAELLGDRARLEALEREAELRRRIAEYVERFGVVAGTGLALAEQTRVDAARREAVTEDGARQQARAFVDIVAADDRWAALGRRFADAAYDGLEDLITLILTELSRSQGGGSGGGWVNALASFFGGGGGFGGKREHGGPVSAGRAYLVGEKRAEIFVPGRSGAILPDASTLAGLGGVGAVRAVNVSQVFQVNAQGAVLAAGLVSELKAHGAEMAATAGFAAYAQARQDVAEEMSATAGNQLGVNW